jgi:signal transduction histidine kinase
MAIYVYKENPKIKVNKNFFYFGLAIFLWCLINFISLLCKDLFWLRMAYSTGSLVPLTGIYFAYALANKKVSNKLSLFLVSTSVILFIINISTPLLIKNLISFSNFGIEVTFGPIFYIWGAHLVYLSLISLIIPLTVLKKVDEQRKKQILYFTTGSVTFALWTIIVNVILPMFGFTSLANIDTPATIFVVGFTSYSIIKYQLMDIRSLFFQAFMYSFVIVSIIAFLLLLMSLGSFLFAQSMIWPLYIMAFIVSVTLFLIGRLFFIEKTNLEKAKINLTNLLETSEKHRKIAELERDKTVRIVNNFTDGLIIINEKNEITSINPEAIKILGINTNSIINKHIQSLEFFPKAKILFLALKTKNNYILRKKIELSKDLIIELSIIPLSLEKNNIGYIVVLHDISREETVEKMKTEFVSLAAHQLRTPLSIINWSMNMLKNGEFGKLTKKQTEVIENAFNNNKRLISLVNDLLDVTHIEEGIYLYKITMSDVKEIVLLAIEGYKEEIKKRRIKIELKELNILPKIMIDAVKIRLVIQNFIDNAIKYSPEGVNVVITLKSDENNLELKIQDFGFGISKDQQQKIFTKFFRGDNAIKTKEIGSGLGLFLSKNIIEAHGGKIWFESQENTGTSFYFSLPIKK